MTRNYPVVSGPDNRPVIGHFRLDARIGVGGMAAVFLATDVDADEDAPQVVIKVLRSDRISDEHLRMFLDEARICSQIDHPSVPELYEVGEVSGVPFLAMEFVDGPTLEQVNAVLAADRLEDLPYLCRMMAEIARVTHHAYSFVPPGDDEPLGVVHRDISLSNALVSRDGRTMLVDFGIAKGSRRFASTTVGTIKGSFEYLAPEQLAGGEIDHRTDLFQIGLSLYRLAVGAEPFAGDSVAALLQARLRSSFRDPVELNPRFPQGLSDILRKALSSDPDLRFQTGEELAEALDDFIHSSSGRVIGPLQMSTWLEERLPRGEGGWRRLSPLEGGSTWTGDIASLLPQAAAHLSAHADPSPAVPDPDLLTRAQTPPPPAQTPEPVPEASRPKPVLWIALSVAAAVLVSVATVSVAMWSRSGDDASEVASGDAAATVYLDEAERLVEEGRHAQALDLVERASQLNPTDPHVGLRLEKLRFTAAQETRLSAGRQALERGDRDAARAHAEEAMEADPAEERAQELWADAVAVPAPAGESEEQALERRQAARAAAAERAEIARQRKAEQEAARRAREATVASERRREAAAREASATKEVAAEAAPAPVVVSAASTSSGGEAALASAAVAGESSRAASKVTATEGPSELAGTAWDPGALSAAPASSEDVVVLADAEGEASEVAAAAASPRRSTGSALPDPTSAYVKVGSLERVQSVLRSAEDAASEVGVPSSYSRGVTALLYKALEKSGPGEDGYVLNPRAITEQVVTGYRAGTSRALLMSTIRRSGGR